MSPEEISTAISGIIEHVGAHTPLGNFLSELFFSINASTSEDLDPVLLSLLFCPTNHFFEHRDKEQLINDVSQILAVSDRELYLGVVRVLQLLTYVAGQLHIQKLASNLKEINFESIDPLNHSD